MGTGVLVLVIGTFDICPAPRGIVSDFVLRISHFSRRVDRVSKP